MGFDDYGWGPLYHAVSWRGREGREGEEGVQVCKCFVGREQCIRCPAKGLRNHFYTIPNFAHSSLG